MLDYKDKTIKLQTEVYDELRYFFIEPSLKGLRSLAWCFPLGSLFYTYKEDGMKIEKSTNYQWECHNCGKHKKTNYFLWFDYLCQHFVSLCPRCFKLIKQQFKEAHHENEG